MEGNTLVAARRIHHRVIDWWCVFNFKHWGEKQRICERQRPILDREKNSFIGRQNAQQCRTS